MDVIVVLTFSTTCIHVEKVSMSRVRWISTEWRLRMKRY